MTRKKLDHETFIEGRFVTPTPSGRVSLPTAATPPQLSCICTPERRRFSHKSQSEFTCQKIEPQPPENTSWCYWMANLDATSPQNLHISTSPLPHPHFTQRRPMRHSPRRESPKRPTALLIPGNNCRTRVSYPSNFSGSSKATHLGNWNTLCQVNNFKFHLYSFEA